MSLPDGVDPFEDIHNWLCDCGMRGRLADSAWRWNGTCWEHHHGYPAGHMPTRRVPFDRPCEGCDEYLEKPGACEHCTRNIEGIIGC